MGEKYKKKKEKKLVSKNILTFLALKKRDRDIFLDWQRGTVFAGIFPSGPLD